MQNNLNRREKRCIEELSLIDDFMFTEASIDEQTALLLMKLIIERATELKIGQLQIEPQKFVNGVDTDKHGIRMDVTIREVEEDGKTIQLFDVEPNNVIGVDLPRRSRYYQALIDVKLLDTGMKYDHLPDMWTIWLLPYDPFGQDYILYSVKNVVEENEDIKYNDGVRKLFLYTGGTKGGTEKLRNLLRYIESSIEANAVDDELKELHANVTRLKNRKEIGVKYMNMQEVMEYKIQEAVEEATREVTKEVTKEVTRAVTKEVGKETIKRMSRLTKMLLDSGRMEDLRKTTEDPEFLAEKLKEFSL